MQEEEEERDDSERRKQESKEARGNKGNDGKESIWGAVVGRLPTMLAAEVTATLMRALAGSGYKRAPSV